jgi:hypothetical protein
MNAADHVLLLCWFDAASLDTSFAAPKANRRPVRRIKAFVVQLA